MPSQQVSRFNGGLTDNYIGAEANEWKLASNLVITQDERLQTREGSSLDDTTLTGARVALSTTRRINLLMELGGTIFKQVGATIQYLITNTITELKDQHRAPQSAFPAAVEAYSFTKFLDQILVAGDEISRPSLIFNASGFQLRTYGLPRPTGTPNFIGASGSGSSYIYAFVFKWTYLVGLKTFVERSAPMYVTKTESTPATSVDVSDLFSTLKTTATHYEYSNGSIELEIYRTENNGTIFYYSGTTKIFSGVITSGSDTITGISSTASFTVSDAFSSPNFTSTSTILAKTATTLQISTNANSSAADGAFSKDVTISFSINNEQLYTTGGILENYRPPACRFVHATTGFTYYGYGYEISPTTDADGELQKNRLWQSKTYQGYAVPQGSFVDMDFPITAVSSIRSIPIVFTDSAEGRAIYRIDGVFDDAGRGGMIAQKISDVVGGVGQLSVVQTVDGLFFAGSDGFYFTDGQKVTPISDKFRQTYAGLVDSDTKKKRIYGAFDSQKKRIYWAARYQDIEGSDNNAMFVLDIRNGSFLGPWTSGYNGVGPALTAVTGTVTASSASITGLVSAPPVGSAAFGEGIPRNALVKSVSGSGPYAAVLTKNATASFTITSSATVKFVEETSDYRGISFFETFQPTALLVYNDLLYRADIRGYTILTKSPVASNQEDLRIDTSVAAPSSWLTQPIFYEYESSAMDFGIPERKYGNGITATLRNMQSVGSNLSIQPKSENDANLEPQAMGEIKETFTLTWGDPSISYGDPRLWLSKTKIIAIRRRFPFNSLRYSYKQIHLTNSFTAIYNSDTKGLATLSGTGQVRSLTLASGQWAANIEDYFASFSDDNYTNQYRIIERTSATVLSVFVGDLTVINSAKEWEITGFKKGDIMSLVSMAIDFTPMGDTQTPFQGSQGKNA